MKSRKTRLLNKRVIVTDGSEFFRGAKGKVSGIIDDIYCTVSLDQGQGRQVGNIFLPFRPSSIQVKLLDVTITC